MSKQKGIAPLLIIVLIALGISGYLIYTNYSNNLPAGRQGRTKLDTSVQPSQVLSTPAGSSESTDSGKTANWKTYTNERIGYQIKYPNDWNFRAEDNSGELIMLSKGKGLGFVEIQNERIFILSTNQTIEEYLQKNLGGCKDNTVQKIDVNGNVAYLQVGKVGVGERCSSSYIWIKHRDKYLSIAVNKFTYQEIKLILSTFKFTN